MTLRLGGLTKYNKNIKRKIYSWLFFVPQNFSQL
jgi:hypothetical protein